jgi:hypothetical protein
MADDRQDPIHSRHQVQSSAERTVVDRLLDDLGVVRHAAGGLKKRVEAARRAAPPEPLVAHSRRKARAPACSAARA